METASKLAPVVALFALIILAPTAAEAQEPRFRVAFTPGAATVSGDAELAWSGSVGYRFAEHLWFEGDLTWIDAAAGGFRDGDFELFYPTSGASLTDAIRRRFGSFGRGAAFPGFPRLPGLSDALSTVPALATVDGSTLIGTIGIRYEFPAQTERFRPYLAGGLGLNHTDQEVLIDPRILALYQDAESHTWYALNAGAGAGVRLFNQLWADVDARYFRLSRDRNIMRLGGGVSFRF